MLSDDAAPPVDRPNLSKDYLAGTAPEEWVPLRDDALLRRPAHRLAAEYHRRRRSTRASAQVIARRWQQDRLSIGCCSRPAPSRAVAAAGHGPAARAHAAHACRLPRDHRAGGDRSQRAVVMGASFIGLEVAASLRARGIEVHVVAPDKRPMERVLGAADG